MSVTDLPGVTTEGETREEALAMVYDAIEGYLESMHKHGWTVPTVVHERVAVRAV